MKTVTRKGNYYNKLLVMFILLACIPGLVIAASLYWLASGQIKNHMHELHQEQISQRAENIDNMLSYLEINTVHWAFEPRFGERLRTIDFVYDFEQTEEINQTLLRMQGSHPLIRQTRLFLKRTQPIVFDPEYNVIHDDALLKEYEALLQYPEHLYWKKAPLAEKGPSSFQLVHKIPGNNVDEAFGAIIIDVDHMELENMLQTLTPYNNGVTMLLDEEGRLLLSSSYEPNQMEILQQLQEAMPAVEDGSFIEQLGDEAYSVTYGTLARFNDRWTYVSASPMNAIIAPVLFLSRLIFVISAAGLLLAGLLSWVMLKRVYLPIQQLLQLLRFGNKTAGQEKDEFKFIEQQWQHVTMESESLQERLSEQRNLGKEGFLLQLLQGYLQTLSNKDLAKRMRIYGYDPDGKDFMVMHIQILGVGQGNSRFREGDEGLASFAVTNIIQDLVKGSHISYETMNLHDLSIGVLLIGSSLRQKKQTIHQTVERIIQVIDRMFQVKLTITLSTATTDLKEIAYLYEQARQATSFRSLEPGNQWFDLETNDPFGEHGKVVYPFNREKELLQALRMNDLAEADKALQHFFEQLYKEADKEIVVQQGAQQLLGSLQHLMLRSQVDPHQLFEGVNMFERIAQLRDPEALEAWFRIEVIVPFVQELEKRSNLQMKQMVDKIILHMEQHYMEDLSLDQFADEEGIPAYALSKAFKQQTSYNFIDYLTQIRLDHAKHLLLTTDLKMNDIAERVGYQQSYFNRIFKKHEGITPTQFRKSAG